MKLNGNKIRPWLVPEGAVSELGLPINSPAEKAPQPLANSGDPLDCGGQRAGAAN